jgi:hypothetical protein
LQEVRNGFFFCFFSLLLKITERERTVFLSPFPKLRAGTLSGGPHSPTAHMIAISEVTQECSSEAWARKPWKFKSQLLAHSGEIVFLPVSNELKT